MAVPVFVSCIAALLSLQLAASQSLPTAWTTGIATNYGGAQDGMDPSSASFGTSNGACGYGQLSTSTYPYWSVAALSTSNKYSLAGPSQACGQCFEIQCLNSGGSFAGRCSSSQSITVTITDVCPECEADHIDIQALSFNKIAPMALGRIDIQYRRVDCTPPEPVQVQIDSNVGVGGWLRLVVEKTAGFGGITLVQMRTTGTSSWNALTNKFGSAWEISNTPNLPWDFQFTSDSKQTVQAYSLVSQNGKIGDIPTGVQFSLSGSTGSTNIDYDAAATPPATGATSTAAAGTPPTAAATPPTSQGTPAASTAATAAGPVTTPASSATPAAASACCVDVVPPGGMTCQQQSTYGKCDAGWMITGNFCQLTCGKCPASCSGGGTASASSTVTTSSITSNAATPATTPAAPATTPAAPATTPAAPAANGGCTDTAPSWASESCSAMAAKGQCYTTIGAGFCDKSCYRC